MSFQRSLAFLKKLSLSGLDAPAKEPKVRAEAARAWERRERDEVTATGDVR